MSEVIKVEIAVSKEAYELGMAIAKLVVGAKKAFADGVQVSDAMLLGQIILTPEVMAGLQGVELLGEELKSNKGAFAMAFAVGGAQLADELAV